MAYFYAESSGFRAPVEYRFRSPDTLNGYLSEKINAQITNFVDKYKSILDNAHLDVVVHKTKASRRGIPEYECRIMILSDKGKFYATSRGIGTVSAVNNALSDLQEQVVRIKLRLQRKDRIRRREENLYPAVEEMYLEEN